MGPGEIRCAKEYFHLHGHSPYNREQEGVQFDQLTRVGGGLGKTLTLELCFPLVRSSSRRGGGRMQSVRRTGSGCPARTPTESWSSLSTVASSWICLEHSVSLNFAVSRIVRESPASIHAERSSNGSDWTEGSPITCGCEVQSELQGPTTMSPSSSGTAWFRRFAWATLLAEALGTLRHLCGGPGADALGHTGSLPGFAAQGVLFPEASQVRV